MAEKIKESGFDKLTIIIAIIDQLEINFVDTLDDDKQDIQSSLRIIRDLAKETIELINKKEKSDKIISDFDNGASFK